MHNVNPLLACAEGLKAPINEEVHKIKQKVSGLKLLGWGGSSLVEGSLCSVWTGCRPGSLLQCPRLSVLLPSHQQPACSF